MALVGLIASIRAGEVMVGILEYYFKSSDNLVVEEGLALEIALNYISPGGPGTLATMMPPE